MQPGHEKFALDILKTILGFRLVLALIAAMAGYEIRGCNYEGDLRSDLQEGSVGAELRPDHINAGHCESVEGDIREQDQ